MDKERALNLILNWKQTADINAMRGLQEAELARRDAQSQAESTRATVEAAYQRASAAQRDLEALESVVERLKGAVREQGDDLLKSDRIVPEDWINRRVFLNHSVEPGTGFDEKVPAICAVCRKIKSLQNHALEVGTQSRSYSLRADSIERLQLARNRAADVSEFFRLLAEARYVCLNGSTRGETSPKGPLALPSPPEPSRLHMEEALKTFNRVGKPVNQAGELLVSLGGTFGPLTYDFDQQCFRAIYRLPRVVVDVLKEEPKSLMLDPDRIGPGGGIEVEIRAKANQKLREATVGMLSKWKPMLSLAGATVARQFLSAVREAVAGITAAKYKLVEEFYCERDSQICVTFHCGPDMEAMLRVMAERTTRSLDPDYTHSDVRARIGFLKVADAIGGGKLSIAVLPPEEVRELAAWAGIKVLDVNVFELRKKCLQLINARDVNASKFVDHVHASKHGEAFAGIVEIVGG